MTPLYKFLKPNGTTNYVFPGASEDISASYQNSNYKMYFSKYVLINLPKQNTNPGSGTQSMPTYWDFENFKTSSVNPDLSYKDAIVESLRNYVANHEVVIKESKLNNTEYYYDSNALETTSEKIFWKWCKKLNLVGFEPAIGGDEYFSNLIEFGSKSPISDEYFPEILWKERSTNKYEPKKFYQNQYTGGTELEIEFSGVTNFQVGDLIKLANVTNSTISDAFPGCETTDGITTKVLKVIAPSGNIGQTVVFDLDTLGSLSGVQLETTGTMELIYHKLVKYIGEVNGVSNVQDKNRNYTEVYAHIPSHTGETPDVLFRTKPDANYKPGQQYPIIPSQIQPEIMGADTFESPIVSNTQNYPGGYYGQFDTDDFTYTTSNGDILRRSGDFYGIKGDINNPIINGKTIDGVSMDFDTNHYVKMNILNNVVTNFDQFNAMTINNKPPKDFEYNAIMWYYTVENGTDTKTNLYGISFLDNPDNNVIEQEVGLRFPVVKKLVANGEQDGTSYSYNLTLNFNIINDNSVDTYNPEAINSIFSMNLFNKAMSNLASTNDSFLNILSQQDALKQELLNIKQLLYTQTDFNTINSKILNLENLLKLYSTIQIQNSDTIKVSTSQSTPSSITLDNIDTTYKSIINIKTTDLYTSTGILPYNISVPENKSFLINVSNDDNVSLTFKNSSDKLTIVLDKHLYYKQNCEIHIDGLDTCTENKKLDIYINDDIIGDTLLIGDIDLPIYFNSQSNKNNPNYIWDEFKFSIDLNSDIVLETKDIMSLYLSENSNIISNSLNIGDYLTIDNLYIGTSSVINYSGQYQIENIDSNNKKITFNISNNIGLSSLYNSNPSIHSLSSSLLSNIPFIRLNKGVKFKLTRVNNNLDVKITDYIISKEKI